MTTYASGGAGADTRAATGDARVTVTLPADPTAWRPVPSEREGVLVGEVLGVSPTVCRGPWAGLTASTLHGLARLRIDVLVCEAGHPHHELDDLDLEPSTEHLWVPDGEVPVSYLRLVRDPRGGRVVDRVCARADLRRLGLTSALVLDVVSRFGAGPLRAHTCRETVAFFVRHGFGVTGELAESSSGPRLEMYRHPEAPWRE